jgi:hypothetical protein
MKHFKKKPQNYAVTQASKVLVLNNYLERCLVKQGLPGKPILIRNFTNPMQF